MNLNNLKYFVKLSESDSYAQAAASLGISKSTLSHAVGKLEEELEATLVVTSRSGFALTEDGKALIAPAKHVLERVDSLADNFKRQPLRDITIGVPRRCDTSPLLRLIQEFKKQSTLPCRFNIIQATYVTLKEAVRTGRYDFGYCNKRAGANLGEGLEPCILAQSPLYCMVGINTELAKQESISLADLADWTVVALDGIQEQHIRQYNSSSKSELRYTKPSMYLISASLKVALGECVAIDYTNWSRSYPDILAIPLDFNDEASKYIKPEAILYRGALEVERKKNGAAEEFWRFANDWFEYR